MRRPIYWREARWWLIGIAAACGLILHVGLVARPRMAHRMNQIRTISQNQVEAIRVYPTGALGSIRFTTHLTEQRQIEMVLEAISSATTYNASHPDARWGCAIDLELTGETHTLKLVETSRDGFIAYGNGGFIIRNDTGFARIREELKRIEPAGRQLQIKTGPDSAGQPATVHDSRLFKP